MEQNKIVLQFKDSSIAKGTTKTFFPNKTEFLLEDMDGGSQKISIEKLKAVFFVKDFEGNKDHRDNYSDEIPGGGRKIKVHFMDGETVIGYTLAYSPKRHGFNLTPADLLSNNERIFVVRSATEKIEFI